MASLSTADSQPPSPMGLSILPRLAVTLVLLAAPLWATTTTAKEEAKKPLPTVAFLDAETPPRISELRGAWIHSPTGIAGWGWDRTVKALADSGCNALFANLAWATCAEYPSQVLTPHPTLRRPDGSTADRLQECLDACRKYGVQLHVWIVACNMGQRTPKAVREQLQKTPGRVQLNPAGEASDYLTPQHPENVQLLCNAVKELLQRYPVDGVHLDYIRYPAGKYDCSPYTRQCFEEYLGEKVQNWPEDCLERKGPHRQKFLQWRQENITKLLRAVRHTAQATRPEAALSAAVYGFWPGARMGVGQDAQTWTKEGLVDFLCPMNYSSHAWDAGAWLRQQLAATGSALPVYSGLANYMCNAPEELLTQIQQARTFGAEGYITFQLKEDYATKWLPRLYKKVNQRPSPLPLPHQQPRLKIHWPTSPTMQERIIPRRCVGDQATPQIHWPENLPPKGEVKIGFILNGICANNAIVAQGQFITPHTLQLQLTPQKPGWLRIAVEWQDQQGKWWNWSSQPRLFRSW